MRRLGSETIKLTGMDIDPGAAARSQAALGDNADILVADALDPASSWSEVPPDAVIVNPPWGAELLQAREFYEASGYRLASGQFDTSDLFVERCLAEMRPGTVLGAILPDAVFQPEHEPLRAMLLEHTLLLIARLGEGFFQDVYRSTVVVVLRHGAAPADHLVECLQLPGSERRLVRQGVSSFPRAKRLYSHHVPQERFANNALSAFNISQREWDHDVFRRFASVRKFDWAQRVFLGRGIEIGKRGLTVRCQACGDYRPAPVAVNATHCPSCGASIGAEAPRHTIIAAGQNGHDWYPLIVGEDVDRYAATVRRSIRLDVPGIRYKPMQHFTARKLLIRKTGVGLRGAVDECGAATTQAVFHVVAKRQADEWLVDYLQGVVNSRPLLAWYLRWSGENQWRSHPYVTPKILKQLPIPDPFTNGRVSDLARRIADKSRLARAGSAEAEDAIDDLVLRLFGFGTKAKQWVSRALADTEDELEYFTRMKRGANGGVLWDAREQPTT